jgi:hypothetical protein
VNDVADNFVIKPRRRPRPPGPPLNSIDGSFVDSLDRRVDQHDPQARPHNDRNRTVPPMSADGPALPSPPDDPDGQEPQTVPTVPLYQGGAGGQKIRSLENIKKYCSHQDIEDSKQQVSSRYSGTVGTVSPREGFLKRIGELPPFDEDGARAIVGDATKAGLSSLMVETMFKPLAEALGVKEAVARKFWKHAENQIRAAAESAKVNEESTAEERARLELDGKESRKREAEAEQARLWNSCKGIAQSPTLLADLEAVVHRLGVVGEGDAIRGAYLTASSRLNRTSVICLLRRGASSVGKNFLITKVLELFPTDSVIRMSSGSPLSLVYYGGGDEDALSGKVLYLAEAAILADKKGAESPLTILLRTLISEGRIDHNVAVPQADGSPVTMSVKRNGPVVVIVTSARDNIEEEMLTRLMTSDADESSKQTLDVLADVLTNEHRDVDEAEIKKWVDFQGWLEVSAPYDVVIPYREAILAAYKRRLADIEAHGQRPNIQLRIRRDIHGFLTAIKTSAILHKARRIRAPTSAFSLALRKFAGSPWDIGRTSRRRGARRSWLMNQATGRSCSSTCQPMGGDLKKGRRSAS